MVSPCKYLEQKNFTAVGRFSRKKTQKNSHKISMILRIKLIQSSAGAAWGAIYGRKAD